MNQRAAGRIGGDIGLDRVLAWLRRFAPAAVIFAIAFVVDMATGQRASAVWGSIAIVASVVAVFPAVRPALGALAAYGGVWVAFNLGRAVADDAGLALAGRDAVAGWERAIFAGLPSAWLQDHLTLAHRVRAIDIALSLVHGSFFIAPFVAAAVLWWRCRPRFGRYTVATAITFALGLIGFLLVPTAPPWLAEPDGVTRITHDLLARSAVAGSGHGEGFWFEPNDLAALPSIHVAATVLILLAVRQSDRLATMLAAGYAALMSVAVVYLGEHYVLDALLGWAVAIAGWWLAGRVYRGSNSSRSSSNHARPG